MKTKALWTTKFSFKTVEKKHYPKELTHYFGPKFEISPDLKRLRCGDW